MSVSNPPPVLTMVYFALGVGARFIAAFFIAFMATAFFIAFIGAGVIAAIDVTRRCEKGSMGVLRRSY